MVDATLESLAGRYLWLDASSTRGQVRKLDGRDVPGGPLDHAGHWALDPQNPTTGWVGFAVEDKNLRKTIYPHQHEIWDLLAKMGAFPQRVPVLITRRVHYWTYQLFSEIGAIAHQTQAQWFSPSIDADRFRRVTRELGFSDARQVPAPDTPNRALQKFVTTTMRSGARYGDDKRALMVRSAERWERAAPVCANYLDLRDDTLDPSQRQARYRQFCEDLDNEGFDTSGFSQPG